MVRCVLGMAMDDTRATNKRFWKGTNILGQVLDHVREQLWNVEEQSRRDDLLQRISSDVEYCEKVVRVYDEICRKNMNEKPRGVQIVRILGLDATNSDLQNYRGLVPEWAWPPQEGIVSATPPTNSFAGVYAQCTATIMENLSSLVLPSPQIHSNHRHQRIEFPNSRKRPRRSSQSIHEESRSRSRSPRRRIRFSPDRRRRSPSYDGTPKRRRRSRSDDKTPKRRRSSEARRTSSSNGRRRRQSRSKSPRRRSRSPRKKENRRERRARERQERERHRRRSSSSSDEGRSSTSKRRRSSSNERESGDGSESPPMWRNRKKTSEYAEEVLADEEAHMSQEVRLLRETSHCSNRSSAERSIDRILEEVSNGEEEYEMKPTDIGNNEKCEETAKTRILDEGTGENMHNNSSDIEDNRNSEVHKETKNSCHQKASLLNRFYIFKKVASRKVADVLGFKDRDGNSNKTVTVKQKVATFWGTVQKTVDELPVPKSKPIVAEDAHVNEKTSQECVAEEKPSKKKNKRPDVIIYVPPQNRRSE